jgi:hypothetical protein
MSKVGGLSEELEKQNEKALIMRVIIKNIHQALY